MSGIYGIGSPSRKGPPGPPPHRSGPDLKKIAGISLGLVGAAFTLYGAGSGVAKLIEVSLNNFGLVFVSSTISFIFWTCVIFPVGGVLVNGGVTLGLVALFGGVPALPGIAVMGAGVFIYYA